MDEHILDLLQLLEDHPLEAIGVISRMAVAEIKRLRAKIEELCREIEVLEGENAQPT